MPGGHAWACGLQAAHGDVVPIEGKDRCVVDVTRTTKTITYLGFDVPHADPRELTALFA